MKKIIYLLFILPLLGILGGCDSDDPIVFDHEQPQFEIKANAILLEVIMPQGSTATDEYYIVGDFNGGVEEAVGDLEWQLEKSSGNDMKWGIYLNPSSFKNGKTLADGFTFYAKTQGGERSVFNKEVTHTLNVNVGTRTNVWVDRWESYFGEVQKDYYTIYVDDQTGWDELALYAYGDMEDIGWPGFEPTGETTINNVVYTYFELPKEWNDQTITLIFNNNNNGSQIEDEGLKIELKRDFYYRLNADKTYEEVDPNEEAYNGYTIYVDDQSGWDALAVYGWAVDGDVTPAWPGLEPTGTKEVEGVTYTYFRVGEALSGKGMNLIFNNPNASGVQFNGPYVTMDRDFYFQITNNSAKEVDPFATTGTVRKVYVEDNSGWSAITMHYWGDGVTGTDWPGISPAGTEEIGGVTYTYFEMPESLDGKAINFILSENGSNQLPDPAPYITLDRNYFFRITATTWEEIFFRVYVDNQSGWSALGLYAWGDMEIFGGWPGATPTGTEVINSVTYSYFDMGAAATGKSVNLIFNNTAGGEGNQFDGPNVTINRNYYYQITASSATEVTIN